MGRRHRVQRQDRRRRAHLPPSPSAIAIARYRTNGALDPTFSGDGKKTSLKGFFAYGAALDADGRLLVVGLSRNFTARYLLG